MPRNGGNWLKVLRSHLGVGEVGIDLPTALEHPDQVVRVLAAGVVWERTGGRQPGLVLPYIEAAIRSGERWGLVFGCQLLAAMGPTAGDIIPLVWEHLRHPEWGVRTNAAFAILKCCRDRQLLAEAAALSEPEPETGDGLADTSIRYVTDKLRRAAEAEPAAARTRPTHPFLGVRSLPSGPGR